jgi:hypothetical protein
MRQSALYIVFAFLGAIILVAAVDSDWLVAAGIGAALGVLAAFVVHIYPHDIAPPADRRHEATQRRKGARV